MGKPGAKAGNSLAPPTKVSRQVDSSKGHLRDQRTIKRLKMYTSKVVRNEKGDIIKGSVLSASDRTDQSMARVAPDRRWFGNTRVIGQQALQDFRKEMGAKYHDPYSVVVKQSKLPLSLLEEPKETHAVKKEMDWTGTFGEKATRKRVRLGSSTVETLAQASAERQETYTTRGTERDRNLVKEGPDSRVDATNNRALFRKGMSSRIWCELYKVIDSSDVVVYVLDARDPMGTRSRFVEDFMRTEKKYKHFVFVLNKCDLIPLWATARWLQQLSKEFPTVAFHASVNHPFGKGNLISLLRQFSRLHNVAHRGNKRGKAPISVGIIGYPNVGKSSVINTLRRKTVCKVAPIPGETKVWQYVSLTRSIFVIDCPGVVYDREGNDDIQAVLKGVIRVERLGAADKTDVIHSVFDIVKDKDMASSYGIREWSSPIDFLERLARKRGKLQQGGVPDIDSVARSVLYDWQRGKIPWFVPPKYDNADQESAAKDATTEDTLKKVEALNNLNLVDDRIVHGDGESDEEAEEAEEAAPLPEEPTSKKRRGDATGGASKLDPVLPSEQFDTVATALVAKDAAAAKRKKAKKENPAAQKAAAKGPKKQAVHAEEDAAWAEYLNSMGAQ